MKSPAKSNGKAGSGKNNSSSEDGFRKLFEDGLKDIYWAEKALLKALPRMAKKATSQELISAIQEHISVTEGQVKRVEQVFEILGKTARAKKCEAMEGLIKEAESIMEEAEEGIVRDAGIIAASQKVEHYEIATYGTLGAFARTLGETQAAELFAETLAEEKEADVKLTEIAEAFINESAAQQ